MDVCNPNPRSFKRPRRDCPSADRGNEAGIQPSLLRPVKQRLETNIHTICFRSIVVIWLHLGSVYQGKKKQKMAEGCSASSEVDDSGKYSIVLIHKFPFFAYSSDSSIIQFHPHEGNARFFHRILQV